MKVEIQALTRSYADAGTALTVLDSVSYSFPEARSVGIIGRSGVGKSTLLHLLGGLDHPNSGKVVFGDTDIATLDDEALSAFRGEHIGFVFQFHHLLPEFSALENVCMPLIIRGLSTEEYTERATEILTRTGLQDRLHHRPGELSGGEQQRVAIARALVSRPDVVLADEPTGNLDPHTAYEVQELLLESQKELGNVLIVVTHSRDLAQELDFVAEMLPGGHLKSC